MRKITLIEGDGIGPEIIESVKKIFQAAKVAVKWEPLNAGEETYTKTGELIPKALIGSLRQNKVGLKGPITTPVGHGFKSVNVQLRQIFDLYQNVRPCKTTSGIVSKYTNIDLVIFRENTEGLYAGLEYYDDRLEIADSIARISRKGCEKIVRAAYKYAALNGRKKITLVHKANILKEGGSVFINEGEKIAGEYPDIVFEKKIVDNMAMQLVTRPEIYDIIVTTNLFGDILSDLCAGLVGGLGVVAGANIGDDLALFEAVHGSAPDIAGKGIANPTALLRSSILMLKYIGMDEKAGLIDKALNETLKIQEETTTDLGGKASTTEFTDNIIRKL